MTTLKKDTNKKQNVILQKIWKVIKPLIPSIIIVAIIAVAAVYVINTKAPTEEKEPIPP